MIRDPLGIIGILLLIEIFILYLSSHPRFKFLFNFLPSVFWIYFLPMLASTAGWIDSKSPIYSKISTQLLPASLFLLLIAVDIKAIIRLGKTAIILFLSGSFGIMLGTVVVFSVFKEWVGREFWSGFGALSGSWTGGSANMIAVKESLGTPDSVFLPMVIVDTIVPYVWMGILVALAGFQSLYDRWNRSDRRILDDLSRKAKEVAQKLTSTEQHHKERIEVVLESICVIGLAILISFVTQWISQFIPQIKNVISTYAWTIILISLLGISLSLTPFKKMESFGSTKIGYFLLYFVLTSIGAKASLADIHSTLILILAGFLIALIHAGVLFFVSRLMKAPLFLTAVASQANLGGVASTPIIAEIYQPGLASVGLLLAILGNILGTYFGIMTGQVCHFLAGTI